MALSASLMEPYSSKRVSQWDWEPDTAPAPRDRMRAGGWEQRAITSAQRNQEENRGFLHSPDPKLCVLSITWRTRHILAQPEGRKLAVNFTLLSSEVHLPPKLYVPMHSGVLKNYSENKSFRWRYNQISVLSPVLYFNFFKKRLGRAMLNLKGCTDNVVVSSSKAGSRKRRIQAIFPITNKSTP